jgi:hypothetical protein
MNREGSLYCTDPGCRLDIGGVGSISEQCWGCYCVMSSYVPIVVSLNVCVICIIVGEFEFMAPIEPRYRAATKDRASISSLDLGSSLDVEARFRIEARCRGSIQDRGSILWIEPRY